MIPKVFLEPAAEKLCRDTSKPPFIYQLGPEKGRETLTSLQDSPVFKHPAHIEDRMTDLGKHGKINVRIIRPENGKGKLPVLFYIHGAGWVFGNARTHDKLVRELAARTNSVVVFPEYDLSPEAKFPVAVNQCFEVLKKVVTEADKENWDAKNVIVCGDSVGGNMAAVMTLMAKMQNGPKLRGQVLFYPVTDYTLDTQSYKDFATGYYLSQEGMGWFWNQYTANEDERREIAASPIRAGIDELKGLPEALLITAEADVLRDEGEAYGAKLREAGVPVTAVRMLGMVHDFVMLNMLDQTQACRGAMDLAVAWIIARNR